MTTDKNKKFVYIKFQTKEELENFTLSLQNNYALYQTLKKQPKQVVEQYIYKYLNVYTVENEDVKYIKVINSESGKEHNYEITIVKREFPKYKTIKGNVSVPIYYDVNIIRI